MKKQFSINFFIASYKTDSKLNTIFLRIRFNNEKAEVSTKLTVAMGGWDNESQRTFNDKLTNNKLANIELKFQEFLDELKYTKQPISAKILKEIFLDFQNGINIGDKKALKNQLLGYFKKQIFERENFKKDEYSTGTIKHYKVTLSHIEKFLIKNNIETASLQDIDYNFLNNWDKYLISTPNEQYDRPMVRNTANKNHHRLKAVLNDAVKEGLIIRNPYDNFKLSFTQTHRDFLTPDELELLKNSELGNNYSLQKVRDIYLFTVYTGLRFTDAQNLKIKNIVKDSSGESWIYCNQEKVDEILNIPLLPQAQEIISKYDSLSERKISGNILPKISNQKVNAYLDAIAKILGIEKKLTHHTARHTCATTVILDNGGTIDTVQAFLGQKDPRSARIYGKITSQRLLNDMNAIKNKLNG